MPTSTTRARTRALNSELAPPPHRLRQASHSEALAAVTMNDSSSLEALSDTITLLSEKPYELSLHAQHIRLADATDAEQALAAREMMTAFWPAGDDVWLPIITAKRQSVNVQSAEGIIEVLAMYEAAEGDYLCTSHAMRICPGLILYA